MARTAPTVEVVLDLAPVIAAKTGRVHQSSVVGATAPDGHWDAWIEFFDRDSGDILKTGVETHQATEVDLHHWASVLSDVYLQGALDRATSSPTETEIHRGLVRRARVAGRRELPALDPFELFQHGEHVLRRELRLYKRAALRALIIKDALNPTGLDLSTLTKNQLVTFIVTAFQAQYSRAVRAA